MSFPGPDHHHRPTGGSFGVPTGQPPPLPGYLPVPVHHQPFGDLRTVWRYHDPAPPAPNVQPMAPADQNTWGVLAHIGVLVLGWIGPLIVLLIFGERSEWVRANAREALNLALTLIIGVFAGYLLSMILIGIPILLAVMVIGVVFPIIAAVKASRGEFYRYPVAIPFFGRRG